MKNEGWCTCGEWAAGELVDVEHFGEAQALGGVLIGQQAEAAVQALTRVAAESGHRDHPLCLVRLADSMMHSQQG